MVERFYKELDCPDYESINQDILKWIEDRRLIETSDSFWNPIDSLDFMKSIPSFSNWCKSHNLKIQKVVATILKSDTPMPGIHIDTPPARYKLSWPILNTSTTWNHWYKIKDQTADQVITGYQSIEFTNIEQLLEIDSRRLTGPALIDAGIIHDLSVSPDQKYPRIGLQCQLFNEPKNL